MLATTINNAIKNFNKTCDDVIQNCEPIIIARNNIDNIALISQAEYDIFMKNVCICKSMANYTRPLQVYIN